MKTTPPGWPRISPSLYYDDASHAIDWLCRAFGFEVRLKIDGPDGRVEHSELTFGDGLVMVGSTGARDDAPYTARFVSPQAISGQSTQGLAIFVDDVDAHCDRARAAGAEIFRELKTDDYGEGYWVDRTYGALDPEGHHWWFMQRIRG